MNYLKNAVELGFYCDTSSSAAEGICIFDKPVWQRKPVAAGYECTLFFLVHRFDHAATTSSLLLSHLECNRACSVDSQSPVCEQVCWTVNALEKRTRVICIPVQSTPPRCGCDHLQLRCAYCTRLNAFEALCIPGCLQRVCIMSCMSAYKLNCGVDVSDLYFHW